MISGPQCEFSFPPATKSPTSRAAAKRVKNKTRITRREQILLLLRARSAGYAAFQLAEILGVQLNWITSTIDSLIRDGDIERTAGTVRNPLSGKPGAVLVARPWMGK